MQQLCSQLRHANDFAKLAEHQELRSIVRSLIVLAVTSAIDGSSAEQRMVCRLVRGWFCQVAILRHCA